MCHHKAGIFRVLQSSVSWTWCGQSSPFAGQDMDPQWSATTAPSVDEEVISSSPAQKVVHCGNEGMSTGTPSLQCRERFVCKISRWPLQALGMGPEMPPRHQAVAGLFSLPCTLFLRRDCRLDAGRQSALH